jgi:hypothetical protein
MKTQMGGASLNIPVPFRCDLRCSCLCPFSAVPASLPDHPPLPHSHPPLPNPTEPIPPASRDADFLSEIGISMPRARLGKYEGKLGDEAPISIYTTRMAEGGFGMSATTGNGANPLFKSTQVKIKCVLGLYTLCSVSANIHTECLRLYNSRSYREVRRH